MADLFRVLGELLLAPSVGNSAKECDQGGRCRQNHLLIATRLDEGRILLEGGTEEGLSRKEEHDELGCRLKLVPVALGTELGDVVGDLCGVPLEMSEPVVLLGGSEGVEVFEPSFTWHGFRYAQVSADSDAFTPPALDDVALVRQANGVAPGASTAFAAPLLGRIESMAVNTIFANLQGGPGSCGQRDERQFFTGDTQVSVLTSMQHFRLRALFASWVLDGVDDQNVDGSIGYYLPTPITDQRDGSPQWSTGFITATWQLMRLEGDIDGCRAVYGAVQRYIAFNEAQYSSAIKQCGNLTCKNP